MGDVLKLSVQVEIPHERIFDLLTGCFDSDVGCVGYWCQITKVDPPPGLTLEDFDYPALRVPVLEGGSIEIEVIPRACQKYVLDRASIVRGLEAMAAKYPTVFAEIQGECDDSGTADTFLQCCLFGEVMYG